MVLWQQQHEFYLVDQHYALIQSKQQLCEQAYDDKNPMMVT